MHKFHAQLLVFLFLVLSGCEKKQENKNIPIENCTVEVASSTTEKNKSSVFEVSKNKTPQKMQKVKTKNVCLSPSGTDTFTLLDDKNHTYSVQVFQKSIKIKEEKRPITLLTFFASWCTPCVSNIPYLNDLERKYNDKLFISSVLVQDDINQTSLQTFLTHHEVKYFVSSHPDNNPFANLLAKTLNLPENFSIPLSVLYVRGKYVTHYEGSVPVEMLEYDIRQAIQTLK